MIHPKKQIRIIGIDDVPFSKGQKGPVLVMGVVFRGAEYLDNMLSTSVAIDGADSTHKLVEMINRSRAKGQLRVIMLDGIALAGFNVIDIRQLWKKTKLPVIVVTRDMPDFADIRKALKHFPDGEKRYKLIENAGKVHKMKIKHKELQEPSIIHFQFTGLSIGEAKKILKLTIKHGVVPEPIRIAHIIGQGIALGESRGRA